MLTMGTIWVAVQCGEIMQTMQHMRGGRDGHAILALDTARTIVHGEMLKACANSFLPADLRSLRQQADGEWLVRGAGRAREVWMGYRPEAGVGQRVRICPPKEGR